MDYKKLNELVDKVAQSLKVLLAEDNVFLRKETCSLLTKNGFHVIEAKNGKEAWEKFKENYDEIGVVVLDWVMPEMDGLEVCRLIRSTNIGHYTYIIFLSGVEDREKIAKCLEVGADDYIMKPIHQKEFLARIKAGLRIIALEKLLMEANEKLERLATIDELTGVFNRRALFNELKKSAHFAIRAKKKFYIVMIDIDHFKKINDTYGHQVGDLVLKELAQRLRSELRPYDIIGRYGGEEFLVAFVNKQEREAAEIGERLRQAVKTNPFQIDEELSITVTISAGIAIFDPAQCNIEGTISEEDLMQELSKVIERADKALYEAKVKGRDRIVMSKI